jgi:hypothetical protein
MREQLLGATIGAAPPQGEANATNIIAEEVWADLHWGMVLCVPREGNWRDKIFEEIDLNADICKGRAKWLAVWVAAWDGRASLQHPQSYAWSWSSRMQSLTSLFPISTKRWWSAAKHRWAAAEMRGLH